MSFLLISDFLMSDKEMALILVDVFADISQQPSPSAEALLSSLFETMIDFALRRILVPGGETLPALLHSVSP